MRIDIQNLPKDFIGLPKRSDLELKLGEILDARVLKAGAERALLLLKGQKILADIKTNLQPGDAIKVRVTGEFQNQVVLKVLTEPTTPGTSPAEQMLRQAGFTPNDETKAALAFLLKNGLPVTPGTVQTLLTDQKKTLDQILTRLFLPQDSATPANQPTTPKEETGLQSLFKGFAQSKAEILALFKQTGTQSELPAGSPRADVTSVPAKNLEAHNSAPQAKSNTSATEQPTASTRPTSSPEPVSQQPVAQQSKVPEQGVVAPSKPTLANSDTTLLKAVIDQDTAVTLANGGHEKSTPANVKPASSILESLPASVPNNKEEATTNQPQPRGKLPIPQTLARLEQSGLILNPSRNLPELVRGLKVLMQNFGLVKSAEPEAEKSTSGTKLDLTSLLAPPLSETQTESIRELSEKMQAMRLHHKEPGVLLHMELPLVFQQQLHTGVLQIRDDEEQHQLAPEDRPLSILFRLETSELGQLRVMVLLRDNEIHCQFAADLEETRMLLRQSVPDLQRQFEANSYKVTHMGIQPLSEEEVDKVEPLPGQVNFRV